MLEAIVRMSTMKALPLDDELRAAGSEDAGMYMLELRSLSPGGYEEFLRDHAQHWADEPRQPIHRSVDHHYPAPLRYPYYPCYPLRT